MSTVSDHLLLTGRLANGALFSYTLRSGPQFPSLPGVDWRIYGETGEIRISAASIMAVHVGDPEVKVEVFDFESQKVEKIEVQGDEWDGKLPLFGRSVGRAYEALSKGEVVCTFEDAVEKHRFLEGLERESK